MHSQTFYIFHLSFHFAILHLLFQPHHSTINSLQKNLMYKFRNVSCYITSNCIRIDRQYSPHPVPMSFWLLQGPIINQAHLAHFAPCWLATLLFQVFNIPLSGNDIGLHHNVDINNSLIHGCWSRKEVISHQFLMSKSLIIMPVSVYTHTNVSCFIKSNWF